MAAQIVYDNVTEGAELGGQLFAGKKFWIAQRTPMRNHYVELVKSNGGRVVPLERQADFLIADHARKDTPPGSLSYRFIEKSVENGEIENPDDHLAGPVPGVQRDAGSSRPTKGIRTPFTAEDDRELVNWVREFAKQGGAVSGNEIYKQLESVNPRHTWQSWRDRWVKTLQHRPPPATVPANAPPSPPTDQIIDQEQKPGQVLQQRPTKALAKQNDVKGFRNRPGSSKQASGKEENESYTVSDFEGMFDTADWDELYCNVEYIRSVPIDRYLEGWEGFAASHSQTAEQWRQYFEKVVLPQWKQDPQSRKDEIQKRRDKWVRENRPADAHEENEVEMGVDEPVEQDEEEKAPEHSPQVNDPSLKANTSKVRTSITVSKIRDAESEDALLERFVNERAGKKFLDAYKFFAQDEKPSLVEEQPELNHNYTSLHRILRDRWDVLSDDEKIPYFWAENADRRRVELETVPSDLGMDTQETRSHAFNLLEKGKKRMRELEHKTSGIEKEHAMQPSEAKRARQDERALSDLQPPSGTQEQDAIVIDSSSSHSSEEEEEEEQHAQYVENDVEKDIDDADIALQSSESDEPPNPDDFGATKENQLPSNTPTPRALKLIATRYDTQAILSSPTQNISFSIPPAPEFSQPPDQSPSHSPSITANENTIPEEYEHIGHIMSSPIHRPGSTSTSQSIRQYRRSVPSGLNSLSPKPRSTSPLFARSNTTPPLDLSPIPRPPPSETSSETSTSSTFSGGDPDPPLRGHEAADFYTSLLPRFTEEEISAALKHTTCRPELAKVVLEAWSKGEPLPDRRGVWSEEDDEIVQSGQAGRMKIVEGKHTWGGWGGFEERIHFLERY